MFKKLTDFKYKRSGSEVFGFYIAYLVLIVLGGALAAGLLSTVMSSVQGFEGGMRIGSFVAIISCVTVSFLLIQKKKLTNQFGPILLVVLSGILAIGGGALLGLIPAAYLTTRK